MSSSQEIVRSTPGGRASAQFNARDEAAARDRLLEALRTSEERLRLTLEVTEDGLWDAHVQTGDAYYSEGWWRMLGHEPGALPSTIDTWRTAVHPEDWPGVEEMIAAHFRGEIPMFARELRLRHRDGHWVWVLCRGRVVERDERGEAVRMLGAHVDMTARRRAEAERRASEQRYQALLAASPTVVFHSDTTGSISYVNARTCELWRMDEADLLGYGWLERVHPDDRATLLEGWRAAIEGGREFEVDYRLLFPDGEVRYVCGRSAMIHDAAGVAIGTVGTVEDVTERRRADEALRASERHFRALAEWSADVVAVLDAEGVTRYISPACERQFGYPPEELVGTSGGSRVHPDDAPRIAEVLDAIRRDPSQPARLQYRYRHRNGSWRTLSVVVKNLLADPAVHGIVVNAQDVTEREEMAARLRQAQKLEAVGRLAGGVAHDFNNLVQVITANVGFARESLSPDEPALAELQQVEAAAHRAAALTRQLLAFSRRQVLRPQLVDLNAVASDIERMLRRVIGEHIALAADLDPTLDAVFADAGQLEQVVMNLAVNARDAMPGGGTLTIETRNVVVGPGDDGEVPPGAYVALRVRDTGVGMDAGTRARIFEPFFTTREPGQGTGLGLSTVYGIVQQSGGHISVESAPGAGSTFTMLLPRAERSGGDVAAVEAPPTVARRSGTILLVEDEPLVRGAVRSMLERGGYAVLEASHGREALNCLERRAAEIDLVLTDAVMPEMGAKELLPRLRAAYPSLPVVVMSGYSADAIARRGDLAPGVALLQKPFDRTTLLERVRATLTGG